MYICDFTYLYRMLAFTSNYINRIFNGLGNYRALWYMSGSFTTYLPTGLDEEWPEPLNIVVGQ